MNLSNNNNHLNIVPIRPTSSLHYVGGSESSYYSKPPRMTDSYFRDILHVKHRGTFPDPNPKHPTCRGCNFGCFYCTIKPYHDEQIRKQKEKFERLVYDHFEQYPLEVNEEFDAEWEQCGLDGFMWMNICSFLDISWRIRIGRMVCSKWLNVMPHVETRHKRNSFEVNMIDLIWISHFCRNVIEITTLNCEVYPKLFERPNMQSNITHLTIESNKLPNVTYPKLKSLSINGHLPSLTFLGSSNIEELTLNNYPNINLECPNFSKLKYLKINYSFNNSCETFISYWSSTLEIIELLSPSEETFQFLIKSKIPHLKKVYCHLYTAPLEYSSVTTEFINKYVTWKHFDINSELKFD